MTTTRRTFLLSTAAMLAAPAYAADHECAVFTRGRQAALDPSGALQELKDGNARFVGGRSIHCDLMAQVRRDRERGKRHSRRLLGASTVGCRRS